jgi:hypothetical protein
MCWVGTVLLVRVTFNFMTEMFFMFKSSSGVLLRIPAIVNGRTT